MSIALDYIIFLTYFLTPRHILAAILPVFSNGLETTKVDNCNLLMFFVNNKIIEEFFIMNSVIIYFFWQEKFTFFSRWDEIRIVNEFMSKMNSCSWNSSVLLIWIPVESAADFVFIGGFDILGLPFQVAVKTSLI